MPPATSFKYALYILVYYRASFFVLYYSHISLSAHIWHSGSFLALIIITCLAFQLPKTPGSRRPVSGLDCELLNKLTLKTLVLRIENRRGRAQCQNLSSVPMVIQAKSPIPWRLCSSERRVVGVCLSAGTRAASCDWIMRWKTARDAAMLRLLRRGWISAHENRGLALNFVPERARVQCALEPTAGNHPRFVQAGEWVQPRHRPTILHCVPLFHDRILRAGQKNLSSRWSCVYLRDTKSANLSKVTTTLGDEGSRTVVKSCRMDVSSKGLGAVAVVQPD